MHHIWYWLNKLFYKLHWIIIHTIKHKQYVYCTNKSQFPRIHNYCARFLTVKHCQAMVILRIYVWLNALLLLANDYLAVLIVQYADWVTSPQNWLNVWISALHLITLWYRYWRNVIPVYLFHALNLKPNLCIVNCLIISYIYNRKPKSGILFTDMY